MKRPSGDQPSNVVDLAEFRSKRVSRAVKYLPDNREFITDVRFAVTNYGQIVIPPPRLHPQHLLAVLSWCHDMAALALDQYLESTG